MRDLPDKICPECRSEMVLQYDTEGEEQFWSCEECGACFCADGETPAYPGTCIPLSLVEEQIKKDNAKAAKPRQSQAAKSRRKGH